MARLTLIALLAAAGSAAAFAQHEGLAGNLVYRSPYSNVPELAHDLPVIARRLGKRSNGVAGYYANDISFTHSVASGDPEHNSVILWTRAVPKSPRGHSVCVTYSVSTDKSFKKVVANGHAITSNEVDFTVKVEAKGLKPFTSYYYKFTNCQGKKVESTVGRTKTIPSPNSKVNADLKFAVFSCSNYPFGFFNAYGIPSRQNKMDYVLHLGDYIYEYEGNGDYGNGTAIGRLPEPRKVIATLDDYRKRYATYRSDLDLSYSHSQYPWFTIWDDHEVADNTWREGSADQNDTALGGVWFQKRKSGAVQAYFEWMPIRQVDKKDPLRIFRSFNLGNRADLILLDTRQYDRDITDMYYNTDAIKAIATDPTRSLMGPVQEKWLTQQLTTSAQKHTKWRIIAQQIEFQRLDYSAGQPGRTSNPDAWDGYQANRWRVYDTLAKLKLGNNIVLAGDVHSNWVWDLADERKFDKYDPKTGKGAYGAEFVGTAVSSPSPYGSVNATVRAAGEKILVGTNRALKWAELTKRGYYVLTVGDKAVKADYFGLADLLTRNDKESWLASFSVADGANHLTRPFNVSTGAAQQV
ncbi:hypothetical protein HDV00_011931 [Rhizophlyctis rosea]|nr:hypothetical protein HDV00_011931 [Rhizophlyctis rosea]